MVSILQFLWCHRQISSLLDFCSFVCIIELTQLFWCHYLHPLICCKLKFWSFRIFESPKWINSLKGSTCWYYIFGLLLAFILKLIELIVDTVLHQLLIQIIDCVPKGFLLDCCWGGRLRIWWFLNDTDIVSWGHFQSILFTVKL